MATATDTPASELEARLSEAPLKMDEIRVFLDGLSHEERVAAVRSIGRAGQRRLYEAADGFAELRLQDLVPPSAADNVAVRHFGKNTLPAFTHFEKRFCRPPGQDASAPDQLHGFNFQTWAVVTGPGYYVARQDPERPEVLVDYNLVPDAAPPTTYSFPSITPVATLDRAKGIGAFGVHVLATGSKTSRAPVRLWPS
jgi:hypothetical protein